MSQIPNTRTIDLSKPQQSISWVHWYPLSLHVGPCIALQGVGPSHITTCLSYNMTEVSNLNVQSNPALMGVFVCIDLWILNIKLHRKQKIRCHGHWVWDVISSWEVWISIWSLIPSDMTNVLMPVIRHWSPVITDIPRCQGDILGTSGSRSAENFNSPPQYRAMVKEDWEALLKTCLSNA